MIKEYDSVVLTRPLPDHGLASGARGVVVHIYPKASAFEVEFFDDAGELIDVVTVDAADVRPAEAR